MPPEKILQFVLERLCYVEGQSQKVDQLAAFSATHPTPPPFSADRKIIIELINKNKTNSALSTIRKGQGKFCFNNGLQQLSVTWNASNTTHKNARE